MGTITSGKTVYIGRTGYNAYITVNGNFISGSSPSAMVSFVKGGNSNITNSVTSYYCASNGGIANINCVAGGPPAPEINLKQGAANIASAGSYNFGSVAVGSNSGAITFTIENTGTSNLTLSGLPAKIVKSGADAADFTVDETPTTSPVAASGSTTFTVTFTPSSPAAKTASLSIASNDSDENPYTVTLNGTGTTAPPVTAGVSIVSVTNVKATTALATGTASGTGITERGFFWWNDDTYWGDNASGLIPAGYGAGDFSLPLTGLPIKTQLYVAAYVKIGGQVITSGPGNFISITTTDPMIPTVITEPDFTVNGNEVLAKGGEVLLLRSTDSCMRNTPFRPSGIWLCRSHGI